MAALSNTDSADLASGKAQLENAVDWSVFFGEKLFNQLKEFSWAYHSDLEYVIVPYFVMSAAMAGRHTEIHSEFPKPLHSNMFLLMCGNPGSGKSCGFDLVVNQTSIALQEEFTFCPISNDFSRSALNFQLQKQTKENHPFLIMASDEMGLSLRSEVRDAKEWEPKRVIYNNAFTGADIMSERMISTTKINEVKIQNPFLTIVGMTQPKPMFEWIKSVSVHEDGLLDRYLIWVVTQTEGNYIKKNDSSLPPNWAKDCLMMIAKYHAKCLGKKYYIQSELYRKIYEAEEKNVHQTMEEWQLYLNLLSTGKEEEAIQFRKSSNTPLVRYTELVIRFSIGLHLGFHALNAFLLETTLEDIPEEISENVINTAAQAVKRCLDQLQHFREIAKRQMNDNKKTEIKRASAEIKQETVIETPITNTSEALLRKIVLFPAPYITPKAIYRFTKKANAKQVLHIFQCCSGAPNSEGYLGKLCDVKINPKSKTKQKIFFRAPYCTVDTELLTKYGITNKEKYEEFQLSAVFGSEKCLLRKAVEHKNGNWEEFVSACDASKPTFD